MSRYGSGFGIYRDAYVGGGDVTGSGTLNYVARFTSSTIIGDASLQDDGTTSGVNTAPTATSYMSYAPATTGISSLNIASSAAIDVASPLSGDLWWNGTNLYFYNGSSNVDILNSALSGSGTNNYVARWTPDGNTLGDSTLQDDGTTAAFGTTPVASVGLTIRGSGTTSATKTLVLEDSTGSDYFVANDAGQMEMASSDFTFDAVLQSKVYGGSRNYGIYWVNDQTSNANPVYGSYFETSNGGAGAAIGVAGQAYNSTNVNAAFFAQFDTLVGGFGSGEEVGFHAGFTGTPFPFDTYGFSVRTTGARNGKNNYGIKIDVVNTGTGTSYIGILDDNRTVGAGKVLTDTNGSGLAEWATIASLGGVTSVSGTTDRITITGTATAPIVDIASTYVGQTSITTLGTISTGTWEGTAISAVKGGTGQTVYAVGDLLYASTTTALSKLNVGSNGQVLTLAGGLPTWAAAGGGTTKYSVTITGDDSTTDFVITHSLSSRDILQQIIEAQSPFGVVDVEIENTSTTQSTVKFAVAPATGTDYRYVAIG